MSGCEAPETYERLMAEAGFVRVRRVGWTAFFTSPTTRGCDFVALKPRRVSRCRREGVPALLALAAAGALLGVALRRRK